MYPAVGESAESGVHHVDRDIVGIGTSDADVAHEQRSLRRPGFIDNHDPPRRVCLRRWRSTRLSLCAPVTEMSLGQFLQLVFGKIAGHDQSGIFRNVTQSPKFEQLVAGDTRV